MKRAFKFLILLCLSFALVWAIVLPRWSAQNRDVGGFELWGFLIAMPIGLLAIVMVTVALWRRRKHATQAATPSAGPSEPIATATPAEAPASNWLVLATGMCCAAGSNGDEITQRLGEDLEGLIDLDPELRNSEGFPVMTARAATLDCVAAQQWLVQHDVTLDPANQRALALAQRAFDDAFTTLAPHLEQFGSHRLAIQYLAQHDKALAEPMQGYLDHLAAPYLSRFAGHSFSAHNTIDGLYQALSTRDSSPQVQLVIAARSHLSDAAIGRLEALGQLFTAHNQQGLIPGEAACAIALLDVRDMGEMDLAPQAKLTLPIRIEKPNQAGRTEHRVLAQLFERVLATSGISPDTVDAVYCDASRPGARAAEGASAMTDVLAHLDPIEQRHNTDALCGAAGLVPALLAVALAARATACTGNVNLVAWLGAQNERGSTLLQPVSPQLTQDDASANAQPHAA